MATLLRVPSGAPSDKEDFLRWSAAQAQVIGESTHLHGRVGGFWDTRLLKTERSYNYKLAAIWLTPEVIRATARLAQLKDRLSDQEAIALVKEAEAAGDTVVLIEIDPREGSGVIPRDWQAFLQPKVDGGQPTRVAKGVNVPNLRDVRALGGVLRRNYDYDRFWVVFPLTSASGEPLLTSDVLRAQLIVRIYDQEGRVEWPVPDSVRSLHSQ